MTDRYAVVGNPISHSKSPEIHAEFARQTHQDIQYDKILINFDDFEKAVTRFFSDGGRGLNITVPFKEQAFRFATHLTPKATLAGAVNTLALQKDGSILGDTTDGIGLIYDLKRNEFCLKDASILILGAGGAVRGILEPLLAQCPKEVVIANRTKSKAEELALLFAPYGNLRACGFDELNGAKFNTVINGTSASISGEIPPVPGSIFVAGDSTGAYDMMYSQVPTPFLRWAKENHVTKLADGLGMLVGQAAESFYLWRGIRPDVLPVMNSLR
jgi:shikimate dehydrogenase